MPASVQRADVPRSASLLAHASQSIFMGITRTGGMGNRYLSPRLPPVRTASESRARTFVALGARPRKAGSRFVAIELAVGRARAADSAAVLSLRVTGPHRVPERRARVDGTVMIQRGTPSPNRSRPAVTRPNIRRRLDSMRRINGNYFITVIDLLWPTRLLATKIIHNPRRRGQFSRNSAKAASTPIRIDLIRAAQRDLCQYT